MIISAIFAKHYSDLALLHTDNQYPFLQHHAAIFIPVSGVMKDQLAYYPPQIQIESHFSGKTLFCILFEDIYYLPSF